MKFNTKQREDLAKTLYDFAKITFAALIIGNLATRDNFDTTVFFVGLISVFTMVAIGLILSGKNDRIRK